MPHLRLVGLVQLAGLDLNRRHGDLPPAGPRCLLGRAARASRLHPAAAAALSLLLLRVIKHQLSAAAGNTRSRAVGRTPVPQNGPAYRCLSPSCMTPAEFPLPT